MPYGSLYFGKTGFFYKKSVTSARKNPPIGLLNCGSTDIFNKYTPGAGVGAQNRSVRRAKMRLATSCENTDQSCGQYFAKLSLNQNAVSRYTINRNFVYPPRSYYLSPGIPSIVCDNLPQDTPYETCAPWPHFGGLYNTNSRLTPLKGPPPTSTPPNITWQFITETDFSASPVIGQDGTIYVTSPNDGHGYVYAIFPNGTLKWSYYTTSINHGSCAIGKDGTIYVVGLIVYDEEYETGIVYAFNPNDGSVKWTFTGFPTNGATLASPTIGPDGTIYVASKDNYLYAINPDGTFKWASPSAGKSYLFVCPAIGQDGTIYAAAKDGLRAFNPINGSIKWTLGLFSAYSSPAIGPDGSIYISDAGDEGGDGQRFIKCDQSGNIIWQVSMISYRLSFIKISSPAIDANGIIYLANTTVDSSGYIIAINPLDGSTIWQTNYPDPFLSSVTIDGNGTLFVQSYANYILALNSTNGTELWRVNIFPSSLSSPSIGQNNTLYTCGLGGVAALL